MPELSSAMDQLDDSALSHVASSESFRYFMRRREIATVLWRGDSVRGFLGVGKGAKVDGRGRGDLQEAEAKNPHENNPLRFPQVELPQEWQVQGEDGDVGDDVAGGVYVELRVVGHAL